MYLVINIEKDKWTNFKVTCKNNKQITRCLEVDGGSRVLFLVTQADIRHLKFEDDGQEIHKPAKIYSFVQFKTLHHCKSLDFEALVSINEDTARKFSKSSPSGNSYFQDAEIVVHIRFFDMSSASKNVNCNLADFKRQLEAKSPDVTLVGHDGEVTIKLDILRARSSVFRAMFDPEKKSQELQNLRVDLPDSSRDALFLFTCFLKDDFFHKSCPILDLLILADKYDVPLLREQAQEAAIEKLDDDNARETFEVFSKVCPEALANIFVSNLKKIKTSPFLALEMEDPSLTKEKKNQ